MKIRSHIKSPVIIIILVSAIVLIAIFLINVNPFSRKIPGSFEYVRKGEAFFDKGRYPDAIKYFEKARASSPDNDTIRDNLIYAYSQYAVKLAESEKYEAGIEYLLKAYDLVQNSYTMQNLALMYARRALMEAKRSYWDKAQEDLDIAREATGDSTIASKNLGITLFNDAVGEFKAAREDVAILLLKAAVLVYGDNRVYEFLGDIYYKKTELERAHFYFDKASKLDPDNKRLAEKCERMAKEESLLKNEETANLPYFDIKYEKGLDVDMELTAKILEKAYFDAGKDLAYFPKARAVVFFYSEKDFREIFKMRDIVRAFYDGNIRVPFPASASDKKELASYLYHEYTHAIISAKTNNRCPVWLSEGIAVYEEFKWTRPGAEIGALKKINDKSDISIAALEEVFGTPDVDPSRLVLSYALAFTAIEYMVDNWGMKGLDGVLKRIGEGAHAVNAIDDEYLLSEKEFNKRWSAFVMNKYVEKKGGKKENE